MGEMKKSERIVFLDTETTGLNHQKGNHRVIDIACIEYVSVKWHS